MWCAHSLHLHINTAQPAQQLRKADRVSSQQAPMVTGQLCCSKIAEAEAVVSVNERKLLAMHMYMHVQLMH
jgi:hypothetical protein